MRRLKSMLDALVLFHCDNDVCGVPVVFCGKTQCAGNGQVLVKDGNAMGTARPTARGIITVK